MEREQDKARDARGAVALLCNRFYGPAGHSFLYLHYPDAPTDDKVLDFNAGDKSLGHVGMLRSPDFKSLSADTSGNIESYGVTSFAAFPVRLEQAQQIERDAERKVAEPGFHYHLVNWGERVNCSGFAIDRLHDAGVSLGHLTGREDVSSDVHLPHHIFTWPATLHEDIGKLGEDDPRHTTIDLQITRKSEPLKIDWLALTRTSDGILLGEIQKKQRCKGRDGRDKYIAYDIRSIVDAMMPCILDEQRQIRPLDQVKLPALVLDPVNTKSRGFFH